ncbi:hypothetical protein COB64_02420 [Candidatus Wolfebacteria bacterium]|nr:MAG: hypothetical protein COB64_02420 [Candidatus Wolfebacteria bacterium]
MNIEQKPQDNQEEADKKLLEEASVLIKSLEEIENQDAEITGVSDQSITIGEMTDHIKNLTPIGREHIEFWKKGNKIIEDLKNKE